uniref:Uncharacterized protein n=1 Tax=Pristionchus pacificus TaxID=54126 RepID=A0A2A6CVT3_PRIPA|eukprot:PDM82238.1 hypothetical protein PRIPAC_36631 [Pristionchus pacificus]
MSGVEWRDTWFGSGLGRGSISPGVSSNSRSILSPLPIPHFFIPSPLPYFIPSPLPSLVEFAIRGGSFGFAPGLSLENGKNNRCDL